MPDAGTVRPNSSSLTLTISTETPGVAPFFDVYRPSDLPAAIATTGGPLPVIVWANGGCLRTTISWVPLFERWAKAGFVVIALSVPPGSGLFEMFGTTTKAEHGMLIDWALAEAQGTSPLAGKVDTTRIVAAGNSCGGVTAMELAASDTRVASVFILSGSSALAGTNKQVIDGLRVPVGFVVGNPEEDIAAPNAIMDYDAFPPLLPAMLVTRSTGDHLTVSSDAAVLKDVGEIALNWLDLSLYGSRDAASELASPAVCAQCTRGAWSLRSKNVEALQK